MRKSGRFLNYTSLLIMTTHNYIIIYVFNVIEACDVKWKYDEFLRFLTNMAVWVLLPVYINYTLYWYN